jgi:hypothetical protein
MFNLDGYLTAIRHISLSDFIMTLGLPLENRTVSGNIISQPFNFSFGANKCSINHENRFS